LIVFVEGTDIKFLKHIPGIQSQDSVDVLVHYITSTEPVTKAQPPFRVKRSRHWKKKE
jgi:hypothetical protein